MKRFLALLLAFAMVFTFAFADADGGETTDVISAGMCGANVEYVLRNDGVLTISGIGAMEDYTTYLNTPWYFVNDQITKVVIEDGVTTVGGCAFMNCYSLKEITFGKDVAVIGRSAFKGCSALEAIDLPSGLKNLGDSAFLMSGLKEITLPSGLTTVGIQAFYHSTALTSVAIPKSVTTIGDDSFYGCTALTWISVEPGSANFVSDAGVLFNLDKTTLLAYPAGKTATKYIIPQGVTEVNRTAFYAAGNLEEIQIPKSVTVIEDWAFDECSMERVCYEGTKADWENITIGKDNGPIEIETWREYETYEGTASGGTVQGVSIVTTEGAQIRTKGKQGLRFMSTLAKTGDFSKVTEYGTILIPSADIENEDDFVIGATLNGRAVAKVPAVNLYEVTDEAVTFTAVITDIKPKNYTRAYSARAYAMLSDGSVVYSEVISSRDVYTIAGKVLANPNENLDESETAFLQSVLRYVDGITVAITIDEPKESAQVPLTLTVDGYSASISWTRTGGIAHTGKFESGTDYTAKIVLKSDEAFSPNDKATVNGKSASVSFSADYQTMTITKTYEFKDEGYSGIY